MGATSYLHRIPEYSQHDAFSADGHYLTSHGTTSRALYDGRNYNNIRVIYNGGARMSDWNWHPIIDRYAFYFDVLNERIYRYDADADTHTVLFDFQANPVTVNGQSFSNLGTTDNANAMGGQGSITPDGSEVAVILTGGGNGAVLHLNLDNQTVEGSVFFPGKDSSAELDVATITPDGQYLLVLGDFDNLYGTSFSKKQLYAYDTDNLDRNNERLILGRQGHFDLGINGNGDAVMVSVAYAPASGWAGRTTDSGVGLVSGVNVYNFSNHTYTHLLERELWGNAGAPGNHISMSLDGSGVAVLSSYQGSHPNSNTFALNNATVAIDIDTGDVAWLGWDESANNGTQSAGSGIGGYYAQPHTSIVQDVEYADGSRSWKWAWGSDNRSAGSAPELFVGELVCN